MLGNNVTYNNSFGIECNLKEIKIYKQKKKKYEKCLSNKVPMILKCVNNFVLHLLIWCLKTNVWQILSIHFSPRNFKCNVRTFKLFSKVKS